MNDMKKFKVITKYNQDAIISTVKDEMETVLVENIISLREEGVRKALIELGWIPPKERTII